MHRWGWPGGWLFEQSGRIDVDGSGKVEEALHGHRRAAPLDLDDLIARQSAFQSESFLRQPCLQAQLA